MSQRNGLYKLFYFCTGDSINPFDDKLIIKFLQKVIKFPNEHHKSGYIEHECDVPSMRSEFKLGIKYKDSFLCSIFVNKF